LTKRLKALRQADFIGFAELNYKKFNSARQSFQCDNQIFFENLYPNQRFGVETVCIITVSANYKHYYFGVRL